MLPLLATELRVLQLEKKSWGKFDFLHGSLPIPAMKIALGAGHVNLNENENENEWDFILER